MIQKVFRKNNNESDKKCVTGYKNGGITWKTL